VIQCLDEARPICLAGISAMLSSNGPTGSAASGRKIQQHLAEQGLTFTALVEEVRRERALRLLRDTPRAVMEIAVAFGHADVSPFHRAVKRWTGLTPAEVRL
jgi:AraC-like DNA-binding protein